MLEHIRTDDPGLNTTEQAIIDALKSEGWMETWDLAHIDHECVEHGVIHVHVDDEEDGEWIEIDPATGEVTKL